MCLFALALLGMMKQDRDAIFDIATRQQTEVINIQRDIIEDQQREIKELRTGDNQTAPKYFPPGAPV
jgi:uncharacterized protein (DUF305 family)